MFTVLNGRQLIRIFWPKVLAPVFFWWFPNIMHIQFFCYIIGFSLTGLTKHFFNLVLCSFSLEEELLDFCTDTFFYLCSMTGYLYYRLECSFCQMSLFRQTRWVPFPWRLFPLLHKLHPLWLWPSLAGH